MGDLRKRLVELAASVVRAEEQVFYVLGLAAAAGCFVGLMLSLWLDATNPCNSAYPTFTPIGAEVVRRDCDGRCFLARGGETFLVQCPKVSP